MWRWSLSFECIHIPPERLRRARALRLTSSLSWEKTVVLPRRFQQTLAEDQQKKKSKGGESQSQSLGRRPGHAALVRREAESPPSINQPTLNRQPTTHPSSNTSSSGVRFRRAHDKLPACPRQCQPTTHGEGGLNTLSVARMAAIMSPVDQPALKPQCCCRRPLADTPIVLFEPAED